MNHIKVIENLLKIESHDLPHLLSKYEKYIDILSQLNHALFEAKIKVPSWEKHIEALTFKFTIQSASFLKLLRKTEVTWTLLNAKILDYSSLTLLSRSLFENYLIFNYLYIATKNEIEVEFRVKIYELSGLSNRQGISAKSFETEQMKKNEFRQMELLINEIQANPLFNKIDRKLQKEIINGKRGRPAKLFSWGQLFEISPLRNSIFKDLWNIYSNHAHSEFIGILQIQDFYNNYKEKEVLETQNRLLFSQISLICIYITDFIKRYKAAEIVFNSFPNDVIEDIKAWRNIGISI